MKIIYPFVNNVFNIVWNKCNTHYLSNISLTTNPNLVTKVAFKFVSRFDYSISFCDKNLICLPIFTIQLKITIFYDFKFNKHFSNEIFIVLKCEMYLSE